MTWLAEAMRLLERIQATQSAQIEAAAKIAATSISAGGVVHAFGTGHSRIPVEELFPRHGSYPGFQPMIELSMTFHTQVAGANGQRQAMFIERMEGLAEQILANFNLRSIDSFLIFSVGGLNAVPIEMAMGARRAGLPVIAVVSMAETMACESGHTSGTRMIDHADVVIDLCTPLGDALCLVDGMDVPVGPGSTLAAAAIANELKVRTAEILVRRGQMPPVITSRRLVGDERSATLFEGAYLEFARRYVQTLRTDARES